MKRQRGLVLALLVTGAALGVQYAWHREQIERQDRYVLPAFDAYVYMAMADHPRFFTVPPWGYRLLTPWIVHALPASDTAVAFLYTTLGALLASGALLFVFLRRLGHGEAPALLGVGACGLSPPVGAVLSYTFLSDPIALLLELLLLLCLEAGAGWAPLALVMTLGLLAKEVFVYFLPVVFFAVWARSGLRRAAATTALVALPMAVVSLELRAWQPHLAAGGSSLPSADVFWLAVYRILSGFELWWADAALGGISVLAALGVLRAAARPFLRRYFWILLVTLALPFAASVYTADTRLVPFFPDDVTRLLLFALPLLVPLALVAVDRVWPHIGLPPERWPTRRWATLGAAAATLIVLGLTPLATDPYRRLDLRGPHDGRLLLALCRQSLVIAQRLERGKPVGYDPEINRFAPVKVDPHQLERMRWFLREGWGPLPHYKMGPVMMEAREASLVLPCFRPADWDLVLRTSARTPVRLRLEVNGTAVGEAEVGTGVSSSRIPVPAAVLFRGDNLLRLVAPAPPDGLRLREIQVRPRLLPRDSR